MSVVLEQMISEAEVKLTALRQIADRFSNIRDPSPLIRDMMVQNEALIADTELKLGELNRCLLRAKFIEAPDVTIA